MSRLIIISALFFIVTLLPVSAFGFGENVGACEADCTKCHQITMEEATEIITEFNPEVKILDVRLGPVGGLWELVVTARGKKSLAYVDFSKKHLIVGSIINVDTKENITERKIYELSRIDVSAIPLEDALVMGDVAARYRVIVFDDPD
jgi:thiol:disulfide interchange protein DsbC